MEEVKTDSATAEIDCFVLEKLFQHLQALVVWVWDHDTPIRLNAKLEQYIIPQVQAILDGVREVMQYRPRIKT